MDVEQAEVTIRRFAILTHNHPFFHWDLLLEAGEVAWTWRLLDEPGPDRTVRAERIGDHRLLYLDYAGPVSGGRGEVARWDAGTYRIVHETDEQLTVWLSGDRGEIRLTLPRVRLTAP